MIEFIFTQNSKQIFEKLPDNIKERVLFKLKSLQNHNNVFSVIKGVLDFGKATHRLRIGDYRLLLSLVEQKGSNCKFWVLKIGHRKDIYRGIIG